ncbi:hypothetical protein NW755_000314 [Fusarium falciforme]|uniref:Uncharacterized protein n=1 Tax=Fusarium falciforme TaxID=195108 RepID=A0A9W8RIT6_9HYPO|nr:hypothetical protein NW755_000314 [Fusarium falciforme]
MERSRRPWARPIPPSYRSPSRFSDFTALSSSLLPRPDKFPCIGSRARLSSWALTGIYHIKLFVMSSYNYEDDDVYNGPGCCMKCCRALDVGNHDACGACYCRRSFRPDYDRDIYPGWSFGEYYPGSRREDWADTSSSAAPVTNNSNNRGGRGTSSRNTSDSTSHSARQATTASETRHSPENGGDSKDSDKSDEKKAKPKSFCEHPGKKRMLLR